MQKKLAEVIEDILMGGGFQVESHMYSGRGMYGDKTSAISGDFTYGDVLGCVISNADRFVGEDGFSVYDVNGFKQDSMGLGMVIY